jgi:hypothetical protein
MKLARVVCSLSLAAVTCAVPRLNAQANVVENEPAVLYVDAQSGSDSNSGSSSSPLKTIQAAVNKANTNNQKGVGTKIVVNAGVYRETVSVNPVSGQTSAPLTIAAASKGTAIISASNPLTGWSPDAKYPGAYVSNWAPGQSTCSLPSGWPAVQQIALHTEMLFVGGAPMTQILAYSDLKPGTFYVNATDGTVHLWPPAGVDPSSATVEIGTRTKTISVYGRSNIVLRGLVFEHAVSCINTSGATISSSNNVLVDAIQAYLNNFGGLGISSSTNVTVQNSVASYNGGVGFQGTKDQSTLYTNNETDYNNWRGAQGAFYNWASGGAKFFQMRSTSVQGHTSYNNQAQGLWFDTDNQNITIDNATLVGSYDAALQLERNEGPITLENSHLCSSGVGLNVLTTQGLTVKYSVFYNNGATNKYQAQFYLAGDAGGINITNWQTGQVYNLVTTNSSMSGNSFIDEMPGQFVFGTYLSGTDWSDFTSTLKSESNQWYDPNTVNAFHIVNGKNVSLSGWQSATGADYNSAWTSPTTSPAAACTAPEPSYPDFNLSVDSGAYTMSSGRATATIRVNSFNYGAVTLSMSGLPAGVSASFSVPNLTSGVSTLTLAASSATVAATVPVTLWGISGDRVHSVTFNLTVSPNAAVIGTSTALSASSTSVTAGSDVTLSAMVKQASGTTQPAGTVTFYDNGNPLGTASLSSGTATLNTSALAAGSHMIAASYAGTSSFSASSSNTVSVTVNAGSVDTTTVLATSASTLTQNSAVTLTAKVQQAVGTATPNGSVTFYDGSTAIGTSTLSGGVATLSTNAFPIGADSVFAVYSGANGFNSSSSNPVIITVKPAVVGTSTTLSSSSNSITAGAPVTLTATVKASSGTATPTGTVTFYNGSASIGSVALSGGVASLVPSSLPDGSNSIFAVYAGTSAFEGSTSNNLSVTVAAPNVNTTTVLTSSVSTVTQNISVTLTAKVQQASGTATPPGSITFYTGSSAIGTAVLSAGVGSLSTTALALGTNSVTAVYSGAAGFNPSTSISVVVTVQPPTLATSTLLTPSSNSIAEHSALTLTATVKASGETTPPTGTITFYSGSAAIGSGILTAGTASITTSSLPSGTLSLSGAYSGSAGFSRSSSNIVVITVNPAPTVIGTITTLAASATTVAQGSALRLVAAVKQSSGTALPVGTVTFYDGDSSIGSAVLSSGSADFITSSLTTGIHSLHALYGGAPTFKPSTSNSLNITVDAIPAPSENRTRTSTTILSSTSQADEGFTISLRAAVTATAGSPEGQVHFMSGTKDIGSATLSGGKAYLNTADLPVGANAISATYLGDNTFAPSASDPITVKVLGSDFTVYATPSTLTVTPGESAGTQLVITPQNGFNQTPAFSCEGLPAGSSCSFGPSIKQGDGTLLVEMTIRTTVQTAIAKPSCSSPAPLTLALLPLLFCLSSRRRKQFRAALSLALLFAVSLLLGAGAVGCGGRASSSSAKPPTSGNSFDVVVNAQASRAPSHTTTLKLILN